MNYRHTQIGTVIIVSVVLMAVIALILLATVPEGREIAALIVVLAAAVLLALFSSMTVVVEGGVLSCRLGIGLIRREIRLHEIEQAKAVENPWYVGWGIRWIPGQYVLWNVSGLRAVELTLKDGRRFRIGTDEPEALLHAIQAG